MAKLVIQHDADPAIAVLLEYVPPDVPGRAQGFYGRCTECPETIHRWRESEAIRSAKGHVDRHEAQVTGVDPSSVVRAG